MTYITFKNRLGETHKIWATKKGNGFICYRKDNIFNKNAITNTVNNFDSSSLAVSPDYEFFGGKTFETKEDADNYIISYVDRGIKAKVYFDKEVY